MSLQLQFNSSKRSPLTISCFTEQQLNRTVPYIINKQNYNKVPLAQIQKPNAMRQAELIYNNSSALTHTQIPNIVVNIPNPNNVYWKFRKN